MTGRGRGEGDGKVRAETRFKAVSMVRSGTKDETSMVGVIPVRSCRATG